ETGSVTISPLPITPLKVASATRPMPGIRAEVRNAKGKPVTGEEGSLFITTPWPSMLRTLYGDPERYEKQYWSKYPGIYLTGDGAREDEDGYIWLLGREDEVINIAGHRLGTVEVESALVSHPAVTEAAAIGVPHVVKGEVIRAFVTLKEGMEPSDSLRRELTKHVGEEIGPIARPERIGFVDDLPKTRSGKIMRRVVRAIVLGKDPGDISTLQNPEAVENVKNPA
ncbi:MAG: AMP-binding protein, partial [Planctomycetes bacterium]|nr:AMP-binding protein [Planctomycetota bacterium]